MHHCLQCIDITIYCELSDLNLHHNAKTLMLANAHMALFCHIGCKYFQVCFALVEHQVVRHHLLCLACRALPGVNAAAVGLIVAAVFQLGMKVHGNSPIPDASVCIGESFCYHLCTWRFIVAQLLSGLKAESVHAVVVEGLFRIVIVYDLEQH